MSLDSDVLQVVGTLAAMSAFLTGFNSVRAHGHRDRTSQRLDRLYESALPEAASTDAERDALAPLLEELHYAAGELVIRRRIDVAVANQLLLVLSLGVAWIAARSVNWLVAWPPAPRLWLLGSLIAAQLVLVIVMFSEAQLVRAQLVEKLQWLAIRQPWALVRLADNELATVDLLMTRTLAAVQQARTGAARKLIRPFVRRTKRTRDVLRMILRVYDDDFVAAAHNVKEMRAPAAFIAEQLTWLTKSLNWFSRFLRTSVQGGLIEKPPERPSLAEGT